MEIVDNFVNLKIHLQWLFHFIEHFYYSL